MSDVELTLNEYQRSLHTYKDRHHECHALGLSGELAEVFVELCDVRDAAIATGNVSDMVKKATAHGVPLDRERLKKELGDVLWYITAIASDNGLALGDVAQANIEKLRARYPEGFVKGGGVRVDIAAAVAECPETQDKAFLRECVRQGILESVVPPVKSDDIYRTGDISLKGGVPTVLVRPELHHAVHFGCGCSESTIDGVLTRRYCADGECRKLAR